MNNTQPASTTAPIEYLTLNEAAALLKVSRKTLYAWQNKGIIKTYKLAGYLVRVSRAELDAIITASKYSAAAEPATAE